MNKVLRAVGIRSKRSANYDPYAAQRDASGKVIDPAVQEYRKLLADDESKATEDFDKTIVTLSGGALALSLAFVEKVVPVDGAQSLWILTLSWALLIVAVVCNLMSFMAAMQSMRWEQQVVDGRRRLISKDQPSGGAWRLWTNSFNWFALLACAFGIALLFTFAVVNLQSKSQPHRPGVERARIPDSEV